MSFGNSLKGFGAVQELLVVVLMIVSMLAVFYFDFNWTLKIGIIALALIIVLLTSIASQLLNIQKEAAKAQR
ncbi:MAG: hypothetical protein FWG55_08235 [Candidatus Bathyarchaeota archaeon]|nr:hypothetical protein [Candidatus Termiticorpusculum sp.]